MALLRALFVPCVVLCILNMLVMLTAGQTTTAPAGLDYVLYRWRSREERTNTPAPWAPFVTPRNVSCSSLLARALSSSNTSEGVRSFIRRADDVALGHVLRSAAVLHEDVIVLFYGGTWCPWSRDFWSKWAATAARFHSLCLLAVDGYTYPSLNANYGVYGFPTVLLFRDDSLFDRYSGDRSLDDFVAWVVNVSGTAPIQLEDVPQAFWEDPWARGLPEDLQTDWLPYASYIVTVVAAVGISFSMLRASLTGAWNPHWADTHPPDYLRLDGTDPVTNGTEHIANGDPPIDHAGNPDYVENHDQHQP